MRCCTSRNLMVMCRWSLRVYRGRGSQRSSHRSRNRNCRSSHNRKLNQKPNQNLNLKPQLRREKDRGDFNVPCVREWWSIYLAWGITLWGRTTSILMEFVLPVRLSSQRWDSWRIICCLTTPICITCVHSRMSLLLVMRSCRSMWSRLRVTLRWGLIFMLMSGIGSWARSEWLRTRRTRSTRWSPGRGKCIISLLSRLWKFSWLRATITRRSSRIRTKDKPKTRTRTIFSTVRSTNLNGYQILVNDD